MSRHMPHSQWELLWKIIKNNPLVLGSVIWIDHETWCSVSMLSQEISRQIFTCCQSWIYSCTLMFRALGSGPIMGYWKADPIMKRQDSMLMNIFQFCVSAVSQDIGLRNSKRLIGRFNWHAFIGEISSAWSWTEGQQSFAMQFCGLKSMHIIPGDLNQGDSFLVRRKDFVDPSNWNWSFHQPVGHDTKMTQPMSCYL